MTFAAGKRRPGTRNHLIRSFQVPPVSAGADFKWRELAQKTAECRGGQHGKTPEEVYHHRYPANRKPRIEPRERWPRGSPCAKPQTLIAGKPGQRFEMVVSFHKKQRHLPVVKLNRAA